jgi:tRNA-specific 2-thiouridylase
MIRGYILVVFSSSFKCARVDSMKKKVFVGLSGGVDSSVSALLLKRAGYDVTGVFIKVWQPDFIECTWKEDRLDAMRVASLLDIPFITLDLEKEYKEGVIDYMIREYKRGKTPNPDVMCNKEVKFGAFLRFAMKEGADFVATGHYAQIEGGTLKKSKDTNKDQTYFLWTLTKEQLEKVLFPVGGYTKEEVRALAEGANLPTAKKKDSQGLCFVGTIDLKTLLKEYITEKKGDVITEDGKIIGQHNGAVFHTLGERHGFTITSKGTDDAPYFVIDKNLEKNLLVVSHIPPKEDSGSHISLYHENFTRTLDEGKTYEARGRYRAPLARVKREKAAFVVVAGDITKVSGQSLVLYDGESCLGGGIIE